MCLDLSTTVFEKQRSPFSMQGVGICGSSQVGGAVGVSTLMSKLRPEYQVRCLKLLRPDVETFKESSL